MRTGLELLLCLRLAAAALYGAPCNDQYAVPVSSARCFEGWWCSWWDCRYCAECVNYCSCDENILCLCHSQWLHLNSCRDQTCDSGGSEAWAFTSVTSFVVHPQPSRGRSPLEL